VNVFWQQITWAVPDKGLLNGLSSKLFPDSCKMPRQCQVSRHLAPISRMDENADAKLSSILLQRTGGDHRGQLRTTWMKNIHDDLSSLDLGIHEARDLAQNRPLWRLMSLHSATHS